MRPFSTPRWRIFSHLVLPGGLFWLVGLFPGTTARAATTVATLANGMQVVMKENHVNPVIGLTVYVKAGSKYEGETTNGFTHLLEHLLFDGSRKYSREEINEGMKAHGGYINAFTRKELTGFLTLVPGEEFDFALDLLDEMLFHSIFPDEELAKERKVVIEEIRKDEDNPDYEVERFFDSQVYAGTPYARPVLGYPRYIEQVAREEIISYWQRRYVPGNMVAVVVGDFEPEEMLKQLQSVFGSEPAQPVSPETAVRWLLPKEVRVLRKQLDVQTTYLNFAFAAPHFSDPDYIPFSFLTEILNSGEASPLNQALTSGSDPLALTCTAALETQKEFSALTLSVTTDRAEKADSIIGAVKQYFSLPGGFSFTADQIQATLVTLETGEEFLLEKPHYYGLMRAPFYVTTGYAFLESYWDRMAKVTPRDLQRVAQKYFNPPVFTTTVVTPIQKAPKGTSEQSSTSLQRKLLPNGLEVIIKSNPDSKVFAFTLLGKYRSAQERDDQAGMTDFIHRMLARGTQSRSKEAIASVLRAMGAELTTNDNPAIPYDDIYTTRAYSFIKLQTVDRFADSALALVADLVLHPLFAAGEIAKTKREVFDLLRREEQSPTQAARNLFYRTIFAGGPYAKTVMGDSATVAGFTPDEIAAYHRTYFSGGNLILAVATGLPATSVLEKIKTFFASLPTLSRELPQVIRPEAPAELHEVEKPLKKEQISICVGTLLPGANDPDIPALQVMNAILSARLGLELREKQGLAYSVGSSVTFDRNFGWLMIQLGTGKGNFALAQKGISGEIEKLQNGGVGDDELQKARKSLWGNYLLANLSRLNQTYWMAVNQFIGRGFDYDQKFVARLEAVTTKDVQRAAQQYLNLKHAVLTTAGMR